MGWEALVAVVAAVAGAIAAVAGFGIGSLLTPTLAASAGFKVVLVAVLGVVAGTLLGERLLRRIPERFFRRAVSSVILVLGVYEFWVFASELVAHR